MRGVVLSVALPGLWPGRTDVGEKTGSRNRSERKEGVIKRTKRSALHIPPGRKTELDFKLRSIGADLGVRKKRCRKARVPVVGADEYP